METGAQKGGLRGTKGDYTIKKSIQLKHKAKREKFRCRENGQVTNGEKEALKTFS